jgi:hypothetical protein
MSCDQPGPVSSCVIDHRPSAEARRHEKLNHPFVLDGGQGIRGMVGQTRQGVLQMIPSENPATFIFLTFRFHFNEN